MFLSPGPVSKAVEAKCAQVSDVVLRRVSSSSELPPEYIEVLTRTEAQSLDQGWDWYRNLIAAVYPCDEVCLVAVETSEEGAAALPCAVLPVRIVRAGSQYEIFSLSNYYSWLYAPVFASDADAGMVASMVKELMRTFGSAGVIRLAPMDPQAPSFSALERGLFLAGWKSFRYFCFANWYLDAAGQTWDQYLSTRSSELRSTLKRKGRKFVNDGGTLEIICGREGLDEALQAYSTIYSASWKREEPYPAFIPGLVRVAAERGWLRLGVARIRGRPVAAQIWLVGHGTANIYKLAYDEAYAGYSVGTLLTAHLLRHVMEVDRVGTVDFLSGDDSYKAQWMSNRRERWGIVAYNPRTPAGLRGLVKEAVGRALKRVCRPGADSVAIRR